MTHSKSEIRHITYAKAYHEGFEDMRHREPDITKLKSFTGFTPEVDIDAMIDKIIDYFKADNED